MGLGAVAGAVFLMALGEELWRRFLPKYLEALGAPLLALGAYGSLRDLLDGLAQYPGGWLADRHGRRAALRLFTALAIAGYLLLAVAPSWSVAFGGVALAMAWSSMASPALFATIGDALPSRHRALGFTVQSILRRVPIVVAPLLGGLLIAGYGVRSGVRVGLLITVACAVVTIGLVSALRLPPAETKEPSDIRGVWRSVAPPLRRLLASDVLVRTCEGLVDVFVVIYALDVVGIGAPAFGGLIGIQMATAIASYGPAAWLERRVGRKSLVIATFVAFALFPLAVAAARTYVGLVAAFVVGGLREVGEPARKALIVDLARPELRARTVGLYYLIRSVSIAPAATIGGLAWTVAPSLPFLLAGALGLAGAVVFALTAQQEDADTGGWTPGHSNTGRRKLRS